MKQKKTEEIFICACHSFEHQVTFFCDKEWDNSIFVYVHLVTERNFFKRIWSAIKYVFGYKSKYGEFDQFIFRREDENRLLKFLQQKKQ